MKEPITCKALPLDSGTCYMDCLDNLLDSIQEAYTGNAPLLIRTEDVQTLKHVIGSLIPADDGMPSESHLGNILEELVGKLGELPELVKGMAFYDETDQRDLVDLIEACLEDAKTATKQEKLTRV